MNLLKFLGLGKLFGSAQQPQQNSIALPLTPPISTIDTAAMRAKLAAMVAEKAKLSNRTKESDEN